jgi:Fe-S oxidoreductase
MTVTYDPKDPAYTDEPDVRGEIDRVFDLCHGCRLCWNLCPSFGSLFDMIDERHDGDVGALTNAEEDRVVDECYQCKLCYVKCPYVPPHEWELDFPRLMLRAAITKRQQHGGGDLSDQLLSRTDLVGAASSRVAPIANRALGAPNSLPRKLMEKVTGIAAQRVLPSYAFQRFSSWFRKRAKRPSDGRNGRVGIFQTCLVEYQNPAIGKDAVHVYERNGIECHVPEGTVCCGMPWLDAANMDAFLKNARKNVDVLAGEVRKGRDVVVLQPTCGYVLKKEYPDYLGGEDARLVAEHTFDASEYLMRVHREREGGLDTNFEGDVPESITWHVPCHLRAQNVGLRSRDLMKLTGASVTVVDKCSGIDGTWGLRARNYELAKKVALPLKKAIEKDAGAVVAGDCHLANGAIVEDTGREPLHPIQVLARAYGIPTDEETDR